MHPARSRDSHFRQWLGNPAWSLAGDHGSELPAAGGQRTVVVTTGCAEAELAGADLPRELRQAGTRQLWILVPLAVVMAAVAQAWSRQHPSREDGEDAPAAP